MVRQVKVKTSKIYRDLLNSTARTVVLEGGARSSKSTAFCQYWLFEKCLKVKGFRGLMLRKVRHHLRGSTYETFLGVLRDSGFYSPDYHNMSDMTYTFPQTGAMVRFSGMDDFAAIKSTGWHEECMEEANEFEPSDYPFLLTRLSEGERGRIYLLYNPEECWIQDLEGKPNVQFFFSSHLDNPFLSDDYRDALESLKDQDEAMYRIFCLGQRAKKGTLVYPNWAMIDTFPGVPEVYGLDFGFSNPSALVGVRIEELDLCARELVYKEKLTNAQLMDACKDAIGDGWGSAEIYADSEAPDKVQEFYDNGFSGIKGYEKKKGSVKVRLDYVKRHRVLLSKDSPNLIKEIKRYSYKLDKNGKPMEEPVKFMDHGMDALGYAAHGAAQSVGDYNLIQVV